VLCLYVCVTRQPYFALLSEFVDSYVLVTTDVPVDRELTRRHQLTLACVDAGRPALTSTVSVDVNVVDIDDHAPQFTQSTYNCSVQENRQPLEVTSHSFYQ